MTAPCGICPECHQHMILDPFEDPTLGPLLLLPEHVDPLSPREPCPGYLDAMPPEETDGGS